MGGHVLEMFELEVISASGSYPIFINSTSEKIDIQNSFLADSNILQHVELDESNGVLVEGSESIKNLSHCEKIIISLSDIGITRNDSLVAIGGGTLQDLATLTASLYMRGIKWIYYPTTLMAMVDSCIGGKSSINAGKRKNLIGNFYPPSQIYIDTKFIETLNKIDLINGLSEAVKICFARDSASFENFMNLPSSLNPKNDYLTAQLIYLSLSTKKWFVEIDEFDKAERQLLNFGHTFAHAIESATDYQIPHGAAVAIGMIAAVSHRDSPRNEETEKLKEYCFKILNFEKEFIVDSTRAFSEEKFIEAILLDKKNTKNEIRLILPSKNSMLEIKSLEKNSDNLSHLVNSVYSVFGEI